MDKAREHLDKAIESLVKELSNAQSPVKEDISLILNVLDEFRSALLDIQYGDDPELKRRLEYAITQIEND